MRRSLSGSPLSQSNNGDLWQDITLSTASAPPPPPSFSKASLPCQPLPTHHPLRPRIILSLTNYKPFQSSSSSAQFHKRRQRMIKNRESATRSRARKQAYTTMLELKAAQLKQESAMLKMEQEVRSQAALDHAPKKHRLLRTTSAPF